MNLEDFQAQWEKYVSLFEERVSQEIEELQKVSLSPSRLMESIEYSLSEGGKRFRPVLALATAEALGRDSVEVLDFALAVEMIHSYSLIHDDLPLMDDDDLRRGQPTNHKIFGEDIALLAGDALLTESFSVIAKGYGQKPDLVRVLVEELSRVAGLRGMVGGQALDVTLEKGDTEVATLEKVHLLKTGALIQASVVGPALVCEAGVDHLGALSAYAKDLGLAFQIADDILDYDPERPEIGSYTSALGLEESQKYLERISQKAVQNVESLGPSPEFLRAMVDFNQAREK